jgi:hypothetical protein
VTLDSLVRTARRAALTAAVVGIPADAFHFTMSEGRAAASQSLAFRAHGLALLSAFTLTLVALAALVLVQQGRAGRLGTLGAALGLFGTTFVIGDLAKEAFGLPLAPVALSDPQGYYLLVVVASFLALAAGWTLTALALRRAGVLSGPATGLLVVGALLAVPPMPGSYVLLLIAVAVATRQLPAPARTPLPTRTPAATAA